MGGRTNIISAGFLRSIFQNIYGYSGNSGNTYGSLTQGTSMAPGVWSIGLLFQTTGATPTRQRMVRGTSN